ncbi:MAG: GreA/GreB family elongation factor [Planctomycetota bacterium]
MNAPADSLLEMARTGDTDQLEAIWLERMESPGELGPYLEAIEALTEAGRRGPACDLLKVLAAALEKTGRPEDQFEVLKLLVELGTDGEAIRPEVLKVLEKAHGKESWYEDYLERSGLTGEDRLRESLEKWEQLKGFSPGSVVYHRNRGTVGQVVRFIPSEGDIEVDFEKGASTIFPLENADDVLQPLPDEDLRTMRIQNLEATQDLARKSPGVIIRKVAQLYRGRATAPQVKETLNGTIIPTKEWAGWWKKAKAASVKDPWLAVEGSATRPIFNLRERPITLAEEAQQTLFRAENLAQAVEFTRRYIKTGLQGPDLGPLLDIIARQVEALATDIEQRSAVLEAVLLLEEHQRSVEPTSALLIETAVRDSSLVSLLEAIEVVESRAAALEVLQKALPHEWSDALVKEFTNLPPEVLDNAGSMLASAKQAHRLAPLFAELVKRPQRSPASLVCLGGLWASADLGEHGLTGSEILQGLVSLASVINSKRRDLPDRVKLMKKLISLLTSQQGRLLSELIAVTSPEAVASLIKVAETTPDFPDEISAALHIAAREHHPALFGKKDDTPFWEGEFIISTQAGIEKRREELRLLIEEKIPENSRAIGEAASFGDLSENSEWESAIHEQKILTEKATQIQAELEKARNLEGEQLPDDLVVPGTRVELEFETGGKKTFTILGPWDSDGKSIVSYRSPVALGLLNHTAGETVQLELPGETQTVTILSIEKVV